MVREKQVTELAGALRENTRATRENTKVLRQVVASEDKETQRETRRKQLLAGGPYRRDQLLEWKRPDLVMYAAQLGVRNTSVKQAELVEEVLAAQAD